MGTDRRARGDVGAPRTPRRAVHGPQLGRPGDHGVRLRRAEAAAPVRHRGRRRHLVPRLQRARRRLRPRVAEDAGHRGRRRLAHQRSEDLDELRGHGAVVRARRPRRRRRAPRGHHDVPGADGHARASPCDRSSRCSARTTSTRCSSTTCGPAPRRCSAGSAGAGPSSARALAHERVGIARYARCERLLSALGAELAPVWDELPAVAARAMDARARPGAGGAAARLSHRARPGDG